MTIKKSTPCIPLPIVTFNRWFLLTGIVIGFLISQPLVTTLLFMILLPAVVYGKRASLIYILGSKFFAEKIRTAATEDAGLMRFNNSIALILLGIAQLFFMAGLPLIGWIISAVVALAAVIALSGFCFGCYLYFQFNLQRFRLFGQPNKQDKG
ncbi:MAG: DUF4395 domain-containing protein [Chlorobiaceae bacterium]|nr:DUF4395 domain-containing protein [Chlorobiaceae bacterium]